MGIYPLSTLTLLQSETPIEELAQLLWKVAILSSDSGDYIQLSSIILELELEVELQT